MARPIDYLRHCVKVLRRTPLHPQWLLPNSDGVLGMVQGSSTGLVLDLGCADRWIEKHLPRQCSYIGLDYLATGKVLYESKPDVFADASCLPVRDATIDSVILLDVLEHLSRPDMALAEIHRVLRVGGSLIVSVPFLYPVHDAPYDFQRYTTFGMKQAIEKSGLDLVEIRPYSRSAEVVGLFISLWVAGTVITCWRERKLALVVSPLLIALIPLVNTMAWLAASLLPDWTAIAGGVYAVARKRQ